MESIIPERLIETAPVAFIYSSCHIGIATRSSPVATKFQFYQLLKERQTYRITLRAMTHMSHMNSSNCGIYSVETSDIVPDNTYKIRWLEEIGCAIILEHVN